MSLSFLAPQFLWALLGIPLVILLHFIRARKKRQDVSALFLWKRARELAEARRRFSPSWLLLLQLLFVALAALALAQPQLEFRAAPDRVLVIDASASMGARDLSGLRLARAVAEATELLERSGRAAIVRAGLDATVVQGLTGDKGQLRRALNALVAADREADLGRSIELARSVAPEAELHLFSDAAPPAVPDLNYHPVGGEAQNVGISAFELRAQQAYVAVVSNSPRPQEITVALSQEGRQVGQSVLLVPARGQANVTFPLPQAEGFYEARLTPPADDALAIDDVAYAGTQAMRVVLNQPSEALERALSALPNVSRRVSENAPLNAPNIDLRVLTGVSPEDLPPGRYLLFAAPSDAPDYQTVRAWDQSDPLLRFVDLRDTLVGLSPEADLPEGDWEVLAETDRLEPVLLRSIREDRRIIFARFHPSQTDMVNRPAFPLLIANIVETFRGQDRLALGTPLPENGETSLNGEPFGAERVTEPGIYTLGGRAYSASLLSAAESQLPGASEAVTTPEPQVTSERARGVALWLIVLALLALVAEWLLWSRARGGWVVRT